MVNFVKRMINKYPKLWEIFKFLLTGGISTLVDMLVMALTLFVIDPKLYDYNFFATIVGGGSPAWWATVVATAMGFLVSLVFNYFVSIKFVFNTSDTSKASTKKGFVVFGILSAIGFGIQTGGMALGYGVLRINEWVTKILLTIVTMIFNYVTRKTVLFSDKTMPIEDLNVETDDDKPASSSSSSSVA